MDEHEYLEYYDVIIDVLRQANLGWIVDQLTDQIQLGKTESTEIPSPTPMKESTQTTLPGVEVATRNRITKRTETFRVTTRYTEKEQLLLLIDAVDQILNTALMAQDTLGFFSKDYGIDQIVFHSAEDGTDRLVLNFNNVPRISTQAAEAKHLIADLRRVVNAH